MYATKEFSLDPLWVEEQEDKMYESPISELLDNDEIDEQEAAFMRGYEQSYDASYEEFN